ncbi:hypothetical protein GCM10010172_84400 [Paractinoplanes ferrugineus]|uniref:Uncharacterized protein n=1 Tax=Paractinoplanes ferrugineus TaxID=113564 RepID=A0A919J541_9ACTN|nr:hypothetical protein Afe05nite_26010 [Actinoplanes ferrugineus]
MTGLTRTVLSGYGIALSADSTTPKGGERRDRSGDFTIGQKHSGNPRNKINIFYRTKWDRSQPHRGRPVATGRPGDSRAGQPASGPAPRAGLPASPAVIILNADVFPAD